MELEEELKVVGNSLKSLEVSEEKVCNANFILFINDRMASLSCVWWLTLIFSNMFQANQRVEEYKQQIKSLTVRLKEVSIRQEKITSNFTLLIKLFFQIHRLKLERNSLRKQSRNYKRKLIGSKVSYILLKYSYACWKSSNCKTSLH